MNKLKKICFIPARGGSQGVKNKNIRIIGGKPLIAHAIESALKSKLFEHVIVSTDSKKIANISKKFGAKVPFMRPKKLATSAVSNDSVLLHGIKKLLKLKYEFDIIVLRDCTVPFIDVDDIKKVVKKLETKNCDSVFSCIIAHPNPYFGMMEKNSLGYLKKSKNLKNEITRRQDSPEVYNVEGLFAFKTNNFLKTGNVNSGKILPYVLPRSHGIMIDHEIDFLIAKLLFDRKKST